MTDPNHTLDAARDVLARARDATPKVDARVLRRFEQKIRLTETALARCGAPAPIAATGDGLRAILARAEARTAGKAPSAEQARAIDALRVQIAQMERVGAAEGEELASLVTSLAADTERVRAASTRTNSKARNAPVARAKRASKKSSGVTKPPPAAGGALRTRRSRSR